MYSRMPSAICDGVVADHLCWEIDWFTGVEASAVVIEVGEEFSDGDGGVEGVGMVEVTIPHFIYGVADELGCRTFGSFVGGIVMDKDGMFHLPQFQGDARCIINNKGVSWGTLQDGEGSTPCVSVHGWGLNKPNEVVHSILIVGDTEEEGVKNLTEGG